MIWFNLIWFEFIHSCDIDLDLTHEKLYAIYMNEKNSLRNKIAHWLYDDFNIVKTVSFETMYHVWIYSFYSACDAWVNFWWKSVLFDYDASSLLCFSLMIFYTMMFRFNLWFKDERHFSCICDVHDCNVCRAVFSYSMIIIHCAEKYEMKERCTWWEDKV